MNKRKATVVNRHFFLNISLPTSACTAEYLTSTSIENTAFLNITEFKEIIGMK